jgi:hypothetical protein
MREMIAGEQAWPVAAGDLAEVGQHGGESRSAPVLRACHSAEEGAEVLCDAVAIEACGIGQDVGDALDPGIRGPHRRPQYGSGV